MNFVDDVRLKVIDALITKIDYQSIVDNIILAVFVVFFAVLGYFAGFIFSRIVIRVLAMKKLQNTLVKYGAITTELWNSIIGFVAEYVKWLTVLIVLDIVLQAVGIFVLFPISNFAVRLFALILCTILGLLLGGIAYKIIKDFLIGVGLDRKLDRYKLSESMEEVTVSGIVAFIVKWYVVLLLLTTGLQLFKPVISIGGEDIIILQGMEELSSYIPRAVLGFMLLLVAIIASDILSKNIKSRKISYSEEISLALEVLIIFIAIVLALPLFGFENVYMLEWAFLILTAGVSLGIGLGLAFAFKEKIKDIVK